ncbi:MAG: hypothetical protein ACLPN1_08665, partial [Dissulfurispiraceae bacterium]
CDLLKLRYLIAWNLYSSLLGTHLLQIYAAVCMELAEDSSIWPAFSEAEELMGTFRLRGKPLKL